MDTYYEDFTDGPGGWHTWLSNKTGPGKIRIDEGVVNFRSPWWVDYNHAFPGAGYLHLTMGLRIRKNVDLGHEQAVQAVSGVNRYIDSGFGSDLRAAAFTLRLRGDLAIRGARLQLLVQSRVGSHWVNYTLSASPFVVTPQWSEQTIVLEPDPSQWLCLGSRHDRTAFYGWGPLNDVLSDVNGNIILILFPLTIVPIEPHTDVHTMRAGEDYQVRQELLPEGTISYDWVRIDLNH